MKKTIFTLVLIAGTLLITTIMFAGADKDDPVQAMIVKTQRRDIYNTIGLLGQIAYEDENIIFAEAAGTIEDVYARPGDRLAEGSIVVTYAFPYQEEIAAFYSEHIASAMNESLIANQISQTVQRAGTDCTVRDVYVKPGTATTTGMPIARITGTAQEIRCLAAPEDALKISPGMWAWIKCRGETLGYATVKSAEIGAEISDVNGSNYVVTLSSEQFLDLEEGEIVEVSIYVSGSTAVVSLPVEAITERDSVWWINDDGRCTEIPAEIVMCDETYAWVNLPEGIRVAVGEYFEGQKIVGATE